MERGEERRLTPFEAYEWKNLARKKNTASATDGWGTIILVSDLQRARDGCWQHGPDLVLLYAHATRRRLKLSSFLSLAIL